MCFSSVKREFLRKRSMRLALARYRGAVGKFFSDRAATVKWRLRIATVLFPLDNNFTTFLLDLCGLRAPQ